MKTQKTNFKETEIGLIPEEWEVSSIDSIAEIIGGGTPKTQNKEYWDGDIPWLSVVDFGGDSRHVYETEKTITRSGLENSSTVILDKGALIISARGTVGEVAQLGKSMAFNQSCYGLKAKRGISNDYLYYLLKKSVSDFKQKSHGAVFDTITRETFKNILVPIPPKTEREKITTILSCLDDKIELNRQINANLEKIASALFKRWFVDFEFPDEKGRPYKSSGGKMVESEMGEVPEGWKVESLGNVLKLNYGKALKAEDRSEGVIGVYGSSGYVGTHNVKLVDGPGIVLGRKGNVGSVFWVDGDFYPIDTTYYVESRFPLVYCYYLLKQQSFVNGDSVVPGLNRDQAYGTEVIIPDKGALERFNKVCSELRHVISFKEREIYTLSSIRDSLLPRLMSGKIRVIK